MKPTTTAHVLRKLYREMGADIQVCANGYVTSELKMPNTQQSTKEFSKEYFLYNVARKREVPDGDTPTPAQMRKALAKWSESERRCQIVNDLGCYTSPSPARKEVISALKQRTAYFLSSLLCDVWPDLTKLDHTSGSTSTMPRRLSWSSSKYDGTPPCSLVDMDTLSVTCVPSAQDFLTEMLLHNPGIARRYERARWKYHSTFDVELGDTWVEDLSAYLCSKAEPVALFTHVPKDVGEVRLIAKSSALTISVQKTIGDAIRRALKQVGVDLNDQRVNQEWAEIGSYTGLVATVDLSAASDSISLRMLDYFPKRWKEYFLGCRDTHVQATKNGPKHKLAMVAGMGNGYIFELESALFWAFSMAVTDYLNLDTSYVSVYGDDIIVPSQCVTLLTDFLLYNGFLLNEEKSFWGSDPFRESCGKHFHNGEDVTPVYLKGNLESVGDYLHLINGLSEWSARTGHNTTETIAYILGHIKPKDRHVVPNTWSTRSGLHYVIDETCLMPKQAYSRAYQTYVTTYVVCTVTDIDVTQRCAVSHQITASLQELEGAVDIMPKLDITDASPTIVGAFVKQGGLYEATKLKITWNGKVEQLQKRRESVARDA